MLLLLAILPVGVALGLVLNRWSAVLGAAILTSGVLALGLPLGWYGDEDITPLGGLILVAAVVGLPFVTSVSFGVWIRRARTRRPRARR
jgi:hypothetical protein